MTGRNLEQDLHALGQALAPRQSLAPAITAQLRPLSGSARPSFMKGRVLRLGMGIAAALMLGATGLAANYVVSHDTLTPRLFAFADTKNVADKAVLVDDSGSAATQPAAREWTYGETGADGNWSNYGGPKSPADLPPGYTLTDRVYFEDLRAGQTYHNKDYNDIVLARGASEAFKSDELTETRDQLANAIKQKSELERTLNEKINQMDLTSKSVRALQEEANKVKEARSDLSNMNPIVASLKSAGDSDANMAGAFAVDDAVAADHRYVSLHVKPARTELFAREPGSLATTNQQTFVSNFNQSVNTGGNTVALGSIPSSSKTLADKEDPASTGAGKVYWLPGDLGSDGTRVSSGNGQEVAFGDGHAVLDSSGKASSKAGGILFHDEKAAKSPALATNGPIGGSAGEDASPGNPRFIDYHASFKLTPGGGNSSTFFAINDPASPDAPRAAPGSNPPPTPAPAVEIAPRKVIRSGTMQVEVHSFDDASATIAAVVTEEGGFVSSTTSDKLANGKLQGTITVRVPPDHLDRFLLKLRALGDIKSQQVAAADVTKQYTDIESELRALRAMESRLLDIIKTGKGEVKDLIEAEKQLGDYRVRIEKLEGEIRYYNNLVGMSTMNITCFEKDIQTPSAIYETENVSVNLETEEVDLRYRDARKAIEEAKGRIIESELKKQEAGQLAAHIVCEVPPDRADFLTAQLKQLGNVIRLESTRRQSSDAGNPTAAATAKVEQKDTRFVITMYNLANIAPRQTNVMTIAVKDVADTYRSLLERVRQVPPQDPAVPPAADPNKKPQPIGTIVNSNVQGQRADQMVADIRADVRSTESATLLQALRASGEVITSTLTENPDTSNVTPAKTGFQIHLIPFASVNARETTALTVAAINVSDTYHSLLAAARAIDSAGGGGEGGGAAVRITQSQLNESNALNITAILELQVPRAAGPILEKALADAGVDILSRSSARSNDTANTVDSRLAYSISLLKADNLAPRRTIVLGLEVADVEKALLKVRDAEAAAKAREQGYSAVQDRSGRDLGHIILDVPSGSSASDILRTVQSLGDIKLNQVTDNPQLADSKFARDRLDITFTNHPGLIAADDSFSGTLRSAAKTAVMAFFKSLYFIILGILFLGPILLLGRLLWWIWRRRTPALPAASAK